MRFLARPSDARRDDSSPLRRAARETVGLGLALCLMVSSCAGDVPELLAEVAAGAGPTVIYDPLHRPEPEIPIPNNAATRPDPHSPTGRLLNLSTESALFVERRVRRQLNRLDGFSVFAPITVSFDAPLDLTTVTDETVLLYDLERLEAVPLDLGRGAYPLRKYYSRW